MLSIQPVNLATQLPHVQPTAPTPPAALNAEGGELREAFDSFVGEVFFGQLLSAMRKTVDKPAYFHGGRGEEIFTQQFDQVLAEQLSRSCAEQFTGPMFELFSLDRG